METRTGPVWLSDFGRDLLWVVVQGQALWCLVYSAEISSFSKQHSLHDALSWVQERLLGFGGPGAGQQSIAIPK